MRGFKILGGFVAQKFSLAPEGSGTSMAQLTSLGVHCAAVG